MIAYHIGQPFETIHTTTGRNIAVKCLTTLYCCNKIILFYISRNKVGIFFRFENRIFRSERFEILGLKIKKDKKFWSIINLYLFCGNYQLHSEITRDYFWIRILKKCWICWWPWRLTHFQVLDQIHFKRHNPGISINRHNFEWQPWHPKKLEDFVGHLCRNLCDLGNASLYFMSHYNWLTIVISCGLKSWFICYPGKTRAFIILSL